MIPKVLALDFDGVLWDSAGECFQIGWRAYQQVTGRELSGPEFESAFLQGRPLARTGHDFYLLLALQEENPGLDLRKMSLADFTKERRKRSEEAARFDRVFYMLRTQLRDTQPELWASWQQPYPRVLEVLERWEPNFSGLALATTKDTGSAQSLLKSVGRFWPVFGKEFSEHKSDQIYGVSQHFRVEPKQVLFIDDLLENLQQVLPTGASLAMADWGYNLEESRQEAHSLGIPVVSWESLDALLGRFLGDSH